MFTPPGQFDNIILKGSFYYPAYKHYNKVTNVRCDRCNKENLQCCIGYGEMDLCMRCADIVTQIMDYKEPEIVINPPLIKMRQNMFDTPKTLMRQKIFSQEKDY
jgi:hypothetical protein